MVDVNDVHSDPKSIGGSVPQGSIQDLFSSYFMLMTWKEQYPANYYSVQMTT